MNRRDFLIGLGLVAAAPKLIFDMGKNSHLYTPRINPAYEYALYEEVIIEGYTPMLVSGNFNIKTAPGVKIISDNVYPRRFTLGANGVMTQIPAFL